MARGFKIVKLHIFFFSLFTESHTLSTTLLCDAQFFQNK